MQISWFRVFVMLVYVIGLGLFVGLGQWVDALMLLAVVYWSNVAWFYEGKCKFQSVMLKEAKALMEEGLAELRANRTSVKKGEEA